MKVKLYVLALIQCLVFCLSAQNSRLYTTRQGISTSQMHAVDIDSRGMAWLSGENMIGMFDGNNIGYVPIPKFCSGYSMFKVVYGVKEFKDDCYWVYTNSGLYLFNARFDTFRRIRLEETEDSIYGYSVNSVADYPSPDKILVTTEGYGTFVLDTKSLAVEKKSTATLHAKIKDPFIRCSFIDSKHRLWYYCYTKDFGCLKLGGKFESIDISVSPEARHILNSCNVNSMFETDLGICIATGMGMLYFDEATKTVHELFGNNRQLNVMKAMKTREGNVLLGTDGRGLWTLNLKSGIMQPYLNLYSDFDMNFAKIHDMVEDGSGNIIAVLYQKGLLVIPAHSDCFRYHSVSPYHDGRNVSCITSLCIDNDKNYWIGTDGGGVYTTDGMRLATVRPVNDGLRSFLVQSVLIDKHGTVWAATYGGGVQCRERDRFVSPEWLDSISSEFVMTMFYDSREDIIYVGTNGNGIYTIDPVAHSCRKLHVPEFIGTWISSLYIDHDGTLWIGTALGTFYYDRKKNRGGELRHQNRRIDNVAMFSENETWKLLVATSGGLLIYDKTTGKTELIGKSEGLANEQIRSIAQTPTHVWLATAASIACIEKTTHKVKNYTSFGGFYTGELHRNAMLAPGEGNILFGGDNGILCFTPEHILERSNTIGQLLFSGLKIGGKPVVYDDSKGDDNIIDASVSYASTVHLHHDTNSFSMSFNVIDFTAPDRLRYDYILEGYEKEWHVNVSGHEASYASLPAGTYTLRVRAYFEDNEQSIVENNIKIKVEPVWYASIPAKIAYLLCLSLIIFVAVRAYRERLRQREMLRRIAQKESMKEAKLRMFTSIVHELRSPLTMIVSPLKQLQTSDKDEERGKLYSVMYRNCQRLLNIVKQITDIRKIDNGQFSLHFSEVDFVAYSNNIFASFMGMAAIKRMTFTIESPEDALYVWIDPVHFEKIVVNILSNAFKFTPNDGKVVVSIRTVTSGTVSNRRDDMLECTFYNSGSSLSDSDLVHLYDRFYSGSASTTNVGSGIGLNLVYELVRLHHGTIEARNVNDGVMFVIRIPLGNAHLTKEEMLPDENRQELAETEAVRESVIRLTRTMESRQQEEDEAANAHTDAMSAVKKTLLIVDDDIDVCNYLRDEFEADYNIILAHSGNAAYNMVVMQRPDVVITDLRMPDGDGMDLCRLIKSNTETENIPIIMLTGEGDEELQLQSLNLHVDHFFRKPFNVMLLKQAVEQTLKVRENMRNKMRRMDIGYDYKEVEMESADDKLFARIKEALKKHIDDSSFGVTQLSEEVGISRVHLNRKLKERYGVVPNMFIKSFRLKQAAYLLVNNNVNISEVAYKVGFSSHSYFTSSFRDYFGMSPKDFVAYYSENDETLEKLLE